MDKIKIETAQNVIIEYEPAGIGDRISAALIDYIILAIYALVVVITMNTIIFGRGIWIMVVFYLPVLLYDLIFEVFNEGQTPGKMIKKIKVVSLKGDTPSFMSYFLRWLFRLIECSVSYGSVATIAIVINGKGQRLGDLAADTCVVKVKDNDVLDITDFKKIRNDHVITFPEVRLLTDEDISLIHDVIARIKIVEDLNVVEALQNKTKHIIQNKMGVDSDFPARKFLDIVILDFNHLMLRDK